MPLILLFNLLINSHLSAGELDKPNILFIAVDDLKPLIGEYGVANAITPNIDSFAQQSVVFRRAYSQYPVCGPARMNLLTGLRPETNGILNLSDTIRAVNPDVVTLPQQLINNGYVTAAAGKVFDPRNVDDDYDAKSWSIRYEKVSTDADKKTSAKLAVKSIDAEESRFVDGKIAAQGLQLLTDFAAQEKPFFLAVGFKKPHLPFFAPKPYFDLYQTEDFQLETSQQLPLYSDGSYISHNNAELVNSYKTSEGEDYIADNITLNQQTELIHGYYASTSFVDAQIGKLLNQLVDLNLADNTIVVLWGDHGFHLGDHGFWGKHTVLEQATQIPLMIKVPGIASFQTHALIETTDLYPTILELTNNNIGEHLQGVSQVDVISQDKLTVRTGAVSQFKRNGAMGYSLRTENYRYNEWWKMDGSGLVYSELYDLHNDPQEIENIFDNDDDIVLQQQLFNLLRLNGQGLNLLQGELKDVPPLTEEPEQEPVEEPVETPVEDESPESSSSGSAIWLTFFVLIILMTNIYRPQLFNRKDS